MSYISKEFNLKKRLSINDLEVMVILEGFLLSYYTYYVTDDPDIGSNKLLHAQKMLNLIARFEKMKNLGLVTQKEIGGTKRLIEKLYFDSLGAMTL